MSFTPQWVREHVRPFTRDVIYRPFRGKYTETMPALLSEGRRPVSFAEEMNIWLHVVNAEGIPDDQLDLFLRHYQPTTGDGARRNTNGDLQYEPHSLTLRTVNPKSPISEGALVLEREQYGVGNGQIFERACIEKYAGRGHSTVEQVLDNPLWLFGLADGNTTLLEDFARDVFRLGRKRFGYDELMRIGVPEVYIDRPVESPWRLGPLEAGCCADTADLDCAGSSVAGTREAERQGSAYRLAERLHTQLYIQANHPESPPASSPRETLGRAVDAVHRGRLA